MRSAVVVTLAVVLTACGIGGSSMTQTELTVFAASSLKASFDKIGQRLHDTNHIVTTFSYAGSQTLAAQIAQGAPADVFASADETDMTLVMSKGFVTASRTFARNRLEIAVAKGNPHGIHRLEDLSQPGLVVVIADASVPLGRYTATVLHMRAVTLHPASLEQSAAGVLTKVALGEADAGIVYVSDVATNHQIEGVPLPPYENVVARYQIGVLKDAQNPTAAKEFIDLAFSAQGQAILKSVGLEGV